MGIMGVNPMVLLVGITLPGSSSQYTSWEHWNTRGTLPAPFRTSYPLSRILSQVGSTGNQGARLRAEGYQERNWTYLLNLLRPRRSLFRDV